MLFKGLRNKVMANKRCILCTKELVDKVDEILSEKVIVRDKPSYYTLQRLFDAKQVNLSAITMLEDVNYVLTHMIDDTRQPDLIRYNNLVEAKLSEYERLLDKQIEYDYCQIMFKIQEYTDELLRYGEACYELSEDVLYKISQVIVNDNSILNKCSRTTLLSFNSLMGDEHKYLKDRYCKYVIKGNEALHMLVDLLKKEEA